VLNVWLMVTAHVLTLRVLLPRVVEARERAVERLMAASPSPSI